MSMKRRALKISKFLPVLGIALFVWILSRLDLGKVAKVFVDVRWHFAIIAVLISFVAVYAKSYKWKKIIDYSGMEYSITNSFIAWLVGFAVGMITPGRVGDFYRSIYLKTSNKKPLGLCFATVFLDRLLDIIIMLFFAGIGVLYLLFNYEIPSGKEFAIAVIVMFVLGLIFLFVFRENAARKILRPLFYRFVPEKYQKDMRHNFKSFFIIFHKIVKKPSKVAILFIIGLFGWLLAFVELYFIALALNIDVPFVFISSIAPVINIVELIPVSFSGLGTRDAAMIFFMSLLSVSKESAVAFSLLMLIVIYIMAIPGIIYWVKHPTELPKR